MNDRERDHRTKIGGKDQHHIYDEIFHYKSPRPPVPGEESHHYQVELTKHMMTSSPTSTQKKCYHINEPSVFINYELDAGLCKSSSRPSSQHERLSSSTENLRTPSNENSTPPACLRWAQSLHLLLEDPDGVELFRKYLQSEGKPYSDSLDFWFACEGLKKQCEPELVQQLVKVIYKRYFLKSALPIADELRREVARRVKSMPMLEPPVAIFDEAQTQVETLINNTTYPNFLKSDMYLQYVQSVQNPSTSSGDCSESSSSSSSVSTKDLCNAAGAVGPLAIIYEDMELSTASAPLAHTPGTGCLSTGYHTPNVGGPVRLTKDMLLYTQNHRAMDVQPKPEAFAHKYMQRGLGAHVAYNSYNPVSRQDSELQSLSSHSDARTESDNMSYTDSSVDGRSLCRPSRRKAAVEARQARESAALNRETRMHQAFIPRTQRLETWEYKPMDRDQFAALLIQKLENVKREQETQELLDRKLKESDVIFDEKARMSSIQSRELANAIREKLPVEDDDDQDILDEHVSRVFSDQHSAYLRPRRKEKDGFSTFSSDSGNVHDFTEVSEHKLAMVKSKSMPEYADERFIRGNVSRRSSSKKTLTDLTDSGVSVVSDTPPVLHGIPAKDQRVLAWVLESDKGGRGITYTHSEMSMKHRNHRDCTTSPNANRHRKGYGSRSSSLERTNNPSTLGPAQPFTADPRMPPLPIPNTAVQLEEARRRLMEDDSRLRSRQRPSNKHSDLGQSRDSTLRKSLRGTKTLPQSNPPPVDDVTVVVFQFCDEQFPYRTKIPGRQITLKQFKDFLPKRGNYRYFFKTECEELGNQVIQEEVSNDSDVLPLWEGKIMAKVKPID